MPPPAPNPPLQLRWTGGTHVGKFRQNNEDAFLALTFNARDVHFLGKIGEAPLATDDFIFAVSDGMGGAQAGEFASRITVDKLTKLMPRAYRSGLAGIEAGFTDLFQELFSEIHRALIYLGETYEECRGMGATLSLAWFTPGWMYFAHIGDSRIYYLPAAGGIKQLTHDHSHVGWLFRTGRINEREARTHPRRNSLQMALGSGHQFIDPHLGSVGLEPGDNFLLCSDGLTDGLWDKNILQLLRDPTPAEALIPPAQRLLEAALDRSGKDNITAVMVEVSETGSTPPPEGTAS